LRLENNDDTRLINKLGPDGFPLLGVVDGCDVDMFSTAGGNDVEGDAMVRGTAGVKERRRLRKAMDVLTASSQLLKKEQTQRPVGALNY
jgi:hypothetical protein